MPNGGKTFGLSTKGIFNFGTAEPPRNLRSRFFRSTSVFSVSASSAASAVGVVGVIGTRTGDLLAVGIVWAWVEEQDSHGDDGAPMSRGLRLIMAFER